MADIVFANEYLEEIYLLAKNLRGAAAAALDFDLAAAARDIEDLARTSDEKVKKSGQNLSSRYIATIAAKRGEVKLGPKEILSMANEILTRRGNEQSAVTKPVVK